MSKKRRVKTWRSNGRIWRAGSPKRKPMLKFSKPSPWKWPDSYNGPKFKIRTAPMCRENIPYAWQVRFPSGAIVILTVEAETLEIRDAAVAWIKEAMKLKVAQTKLEARKA